MDEATYLAMSQAHMPSFYRVAYSLVGNRPDAEDAVQQALLSAWTHRHQARAGAEKAWMMRIVINECYSILRRRKKAIPVADVPQGASAPMEPTPLQEAVRALPENLRTPLLLKYMEGMSEKEVASALRIPVSSVKSRLFRARKKLQAQLSEEVSP